MQGTSYAVRQPENQDCPKSWRDRLPVHPAAELFPLMGKDELRELADDIKKNGLLDQIVLYDDPKSTPRTSVLEGRNRLDALELIGRETVDANGDPTSSIFTKQPARKSFDPYAYVLSKNVHRRHLTPEQKHDLIVKLLKADPSKSNRQIAKQAKRDDKTVAKIRTELESTADIPQLTETVGKDGKSRPVHQKRATEKPAGSLNGSRPTPPEVVGKSSTPKKEGSAKALKEFKYACETWIPKMTKEHQAEAVKFFIDFAP